MNGLKEQEKSRVWDAFLTARDREVYRNAGYGRRAGFGKRPALLLIDTHYNFVGDRPLPILEAIKQYRTACGEEGWEAIRETEEVLNAARDCKLPIFYTVAERRADMLDAGGYLRKNELAADGVNATGTRGTEIVAQLAPRATDYMISKRKPSAFFGTDLVSILNGLGVDTLMLAGCTTSGCIRATAVDAFSYNYRVAVIEECTFDRGQASHALNLFDLHAKYADVVSKSEVMSFLAELADAHGKDPSDGLSK